jgi:hypothetical protein
MRLYKQFNARAINTLTNPRDSAVDRIVGQFEFGRLLKIRNATPLPKAIPVGIKIAIKANAKKPEPGPDSKPPSGPVTPLVQ